MIAIIGLFGGLAFGMGWLVISGIQQDHTYLPTKRASLRRVIHREQEPVTFYVALGVYTLVGNSSRRLQPMDDARVMETSSQIVRGVTAFIGRRF